MITKQGTLRCDECNKFCKYYDEYTPYGGIGPDGLDPHEASHICKKCFPEVKADWVRRFTKGQRYGDWIKSKAETEAADECGLSWVGSNGVGTLSTKDFANAHQYITKEEFARLSDLPYWGYCKLCGAMRKGGYCSNANCSDVFKGSVNP